LEKEGKAEGIGEFKGGNKVLVERKTISSKWTFWMKFVFPPIWICGFGLGTLLLWVGVVAEKNGGPPPDGIKYAFTVMCVLGTMFIGWMAIRIKRVRIDGSNLYISTVSGDYGSHGGNCRRERNQVDQRETRDDLLQTSSFLRRECHVPAKGAFLVLEQASDR
jgi:hypothetical protein